ncbi:hypothetical protein ACIG3E_32790 [Streptomyces sp. NPDC053474]|uniref:hypothetical protein n=1 Tax=Streptomyces sp. NPDC053474 TaxID=3365704 RepID=UPI0037D319A8
MVLLAKSPAASARVTMSERDLAGWLGYSITHIARTVIPRLRKSGAATCGIKRRPNGEFETLQFTLLPLQRARAGLDASPLSALMRRELATLLSFSEAVFCPGWAPKDAPVTPPGFMASRRGRGAATDRLAVLLLALEARQDGRVRMAPGRLPEGYSRAAVTVARVLRVPVAVGAEVLRRLLEFGALAWDRPERFGEERLVLPAVRAAYERARARRRVVDASAPGGAVGEESASSSPAPCDRCAGGSGSGEDEELVLAGDGWAQLSFEDVTADAGVAWESDSAHGDQEASSPSASATSSQVRAGEADDSPVDDGAELHTDHTPVAPISGLCAGFLNGFSGSAVESFCRLRERAQAREDHAASDAERAPDPSDGQGPLRGEQPAQPTSRKPLGARPVFIRPTRVPADLVEVLLPVIHLWEGLAQSTSAWLAQAVRIELARVRNVVGPEGAERALARRIGHRLAAEGRPVRNLQGWLLKRALPRRALCWSPVCDDGRRMDTDGPCEGCGCRIGDRRGLRRSVAVEVAAKYAHIPFEERRDLFEAELRAVTARQAELDAVRREREAELQVHRRAAVARQREELAAAKEALAARQCRFCGEPGQEGECMVCLLHRDTEALVKQAVDIAVAMRAELDDAQAVAELTRTVQEDTWSIVRRVPDHAGMADGRPERAFAERDRARRLRDQRQERALVRLWESGPAQREAESLYRRRMVGLYPTPENCKKAAQAAGEARVRFVQDLFTRLLRDLHQTRAMATPAQATRSPRRSWQERLAELAQQPPTGADTRADDPAHAACTDS